MRQARVGRWQLPLQHASEEPIRGPVEATESSEARSNLYRVSQAAS